MLQIGTCNSKAYIVPAPFTDNAPDWNDHEEVVDKMNDGDASQSDKRSHVK
jgi:hypothetical protein